MQLPRVSPPGKESPEELRAARDAAILAAQLAMRDSTRLMRLLTILGEPVALGDLLDRALATLSELFAAEVVVLLDPVGCGHFRPAAAVGLPENMLNQPFASDQNSLVARLMGEGEILSLEHSGQEPRADRQIVEQGVESSLWLPIRGSQSVRGVLILGRCRHEAFLHNDIGLLSAMGYRLGLALEQAQRRQQMDFLVGSGLQISGHLESSSVAAAAVRHFSSLVAADASVLWLMDNENGTLIHDKSFLDLDGMWRKLAISCLEEGIRDGSSLMASVSLEAELLRRGIEAVPGCPVHSVLAVTIRHQERTLGVLFALRHASIAFLPEMREVAILFAGQAASALENARLYQVLRGDLQERLRLEEALRLSKAQVEALLDQRTMQLDAAHLELLKQKKEYEDLYNAAPCGYHTLDKAGAFQRVNQTEQMMLGYAAQELLGGMHLADVVVEDAEESFAATRKALLEEGFVRERQLLFRRKDGSVFPAVVNAVTVNDPELPDGVTRWAVFDDTERKAHDQSIAELNLELERRAIEAEAASRAKSEFLATMSHEVRTPLHAIQGFTELLKMRGALPEQLTKLERISTASKQLLELLNDVLEAARADSAGALELENADFELPALLSRVTEPIANKARQKGLAFGVHCESLPSQLHGDAARLGEILRKLLNNAVKFTAHGAVSLHGRVVECVEGCVVLRFEVEDTGIGVLPEDQERIFRPFEQGDNSATRHYGGTGLGLSIVRRLARLMGGEVGVSSSPGQGSTFWVNLPLKLQQHLPNESGSAVAGDIESMLQRDFGGTRVLVVEDNAINREVVSALLNDVGLEVDTANDGLEGVKLSMAHNYPLILMDIKMPVMDGLQATRTIRSQKQHASTPILALTANAFSDDRQRCEAAGMNEFLVKPVVPAILYGAVYRWLLVSRSLAHRRRSAAQ